MYLLLNPSTLMNQVCKNVLPFKHVFDFILFLGLQNEIFLCDMFMSVNK